MRGGMGGGGARAKDRYGLMDPRARMAGKAKDRSLMVEGGIRTGSRSNTRALRAWRLRGWARMPLGQRGVQ